MVRHYHKPRQCKLSHKIDRGSNGNIMPYNKFKILFPRTSTQQVENVKDSAIMLKHIAQQSVHNKAFVL